MFYCNRLAHNRCFVDALETPTNEVFAHLPVNSCFDFKSVAWHLNILIHIHMYTCVRIHEYIIYTYIYTYHNTSAIYFQSIAQCISLHLSWRRKMFVPCVHSPNHKCFPQNLLSFFFTEANSYLIYDVVCCSVASARKRR